MKCFFCAEEIQDDAILCRFCGAIKEHGTWEPPVILPQSARPPTHKSNFTIRTAAVIFLISAFFEITSLTSGVPLFGAVRGGIVAAGYHVLYVILFTAMGIGLWNARRWGYQLMWVGTIIHTLNKVCYLFDHRARSAEILQKLDDFGDLSDFVNQNSILSIVVMVAVLSLLCWWGFLFYLYFNQDYFEPKSTLQ